GLMSNIADDGVDLLDARGDVADVIDVEALDARAARRHCVGGQERVDAREIVMEGAKVRVLPPQGDELSGERRRRESLSRRAGDPARGEQAPRGAAAGSRAQLEQGLEIAPVVLHEYGHHVHLTLAVGRRGPERVDGSPGPVERPGQPSLPVMSSGSRIVDRDPDLRQAGGEELPGRSARDVPPVGEEQGNVIVRALSDDGGAAGTHDTLAALDRDQKAPETRELFGELAELLGRELLVRKRAVGPEVAEAALHVAAIRDLQQTLERAPANQIRREAYLPPHPAHVH